MPQPAGQPVVSLVLAGGGARGAYEIGALAELLPVLERRGERPTIIIGTSVGAINAAHLAATAGDPAAEAIDAAVEVWSSIEFDDVLRPLVSPAELARALESAGALLGIPGAHVWGLLDPAPLAATLRRLIAFGRIRANVAAGHLRAAAVVATSAASSQSVVFHEGGGRPAPDRARGIEYVPTRLAPEHVRASAAIPGGFPAVEVRSPARARGWYFDGGTRLNTPIKPALALGADRVIVIALNSLQPGGRRGRPDALDGASQLVQAVLVDPLVHDVQTLASVNTMLRGRGRGAAAHGRKPVPYILVAPPERDAIGRIAAATYRRHFAGPLAAARHPSIAMLGHALDAGSGAARGELFSYLFFAREFAQALIERGREDARRWLAQRHDDGPWRLRPTDNAA